MGRKTKAFIDKKTSTTFNLVYREDAEDGDPDGGLRTLAPMDRHRAAGEAGEPADGYNDDYYGDEEGYDEGSEYSHAMSRGGGGGYEDEEGEMTEERRRELLALGFPDDGYDYLAHMRDLGRSRQPPPGVRTGVETIHEDQELDGFDEEEEGEEVEGEGEEEGEEEEEENVTAQQQGQAGAGVTMAGGVVGGLRGTGAATARKKLDAAALAAAEAAAAAAEAAAATTAAGPSTSSGDRGNAAGPGPGSVRARGGAAASSRAGARSTAGRSMMGRSAYARSLATTARTDGSGLGPSVYVAAKLTVAPCDDVRVVDARRLVVEPKGHDEAAAAAALPTVSALARPTQLHGRRGRLYQDLDEVEASLAAMENGADPNLAEVVEGDEWADWLDDFVAGRGEAAGAAAAGGAVAARTGEQGEEEEEDEEGGGESEEPEEEEEDADEWKMRHRRQAQQAGTAAAEAGGAAAAEGPVAARTGGARSAAAGPRPGTIIGGSVASSFWRPERRDRKDGFENLDAQFERLAVEYDDEEIGALHEDRRSDDGGDDGEEDDDDIEEDAERAVLRQQRKQQKAAARARTEAAGQPSQKAAGNCELSDFADVLDEFLNEHRTSEALEAEGLKPMQHTDDVSVQAARPDPEAVAATKARLAVEEARAEAAGSRGDADTAAEAAAAELKSTMLVQDAERWDCESILSFTSNLENHPAKIVEPQRRAGGRGGGLIRLSAKTGLPVAVRGGVAAPIPEDTEGEAAQQEAEEGQEGSGEGDSDSEEDGVPGGSVMDPALLVRRKGETPEERKARKSAVKDVRRSQRTAKKEMKNMFRQQATKSQKQGAGRSTGAGSTYAIP